MDIKSSLVKKKMSRSKEQFNIGFQKKNSTSVFERTIQQLFKRKNQQSFTRTIQQLLKRTIVQKNNSTIVKLKEHFKLINITKLWI